MITLGWPDGEVKISSMGIKEPGKVDLLGYPGKIEHRINDAGQLVITPPEARFNLPGAVRLEPADATLEGGQRLPDAARPRRVRECITNWSLSCVGVGCKA